MPFSLSASLLNVIHAALERRVDLLEEKLALYTALVALGLLYEYGYDIDWFKKSKPPLPKWFPWLSHLGALLVTVGVAGELYIEVAAFGAQGNLRAFNNGMTAILNKEAGDARQEAQNAELATEQIRGENLKLSSKLEGQGRDLLEAQFELADRAIADPTEFIAELKQLPREEYLGIKISIQYPKDVPESKELARLLGNAIAKAETVGMENTQSSDPFPRKGILMVEAESPAGRKISHLVENFLMHDSHLPVTVVSNGGRRLGMRSVIIVDVGLKSTPSVDKRSDALRVK